MADALRLAVGTLTAVPVRAPTRMDRGTTRGAILLAPLAVLPLGALVAAVVWAGGAVDLPPLAVAFVAIGALAAGSRALHWDGLSDTADGLTASYDAARSLEVMKSGTSGPAGVVATVVVLGVQAAALSAYVGPATDALLAGALVCLSRCALWIVCCTRVPPARPDGLGVTYTRTVPVPVAVVGGLLLSVAGGVVVLLLVRRTTRRFGGVTGDVFGAAVELALAATLLTWSWI
ncbi:MULTISPECIES: adenosylcobinamide-GDP ribazoletransferase [unclassified Nocardioides]|uniref:adenosylcobinamide-GDP ribazoletransferase n=1 Tax=unclassified Nocardioides TaxID=2615069 RepID=UPI0009EF8102|nr:MULTISPECIES: adenosylcobinamide-GDP ribazoletransferase [unclassified Nocardioides]GAW50481.1 cobalamin-5'-phosphate synthase [Nocardioides sp. PD653-B2]GAW53920.1 cobalamin-5'-phosphate synthase [Nocardioides sp. PD653]